ncbi:MAG: hypothetical protein KGD74_03240 [Candidatus Lokiarchaeota archaeon]|nr:hypothetical protein [Candidatus Lokiarchaeota archaeon]
MNEENVKNVIELLKLAKLGERVKEEEQKEKPEIEAVKFTLPDTLTTIQPLITVDGSYCFLFSFLGAETWIVLFRIAITEYYIEIKNNKIHYCINTAPLIYDRLDLLSFNKTVLSFQPPVFSIVADIASRFQDRKAQIFASNIMTYLEDKTLEKISATRNNCILIKDGALLTFKELNRGEIYKEILVNCRMNNILLAGVSKSTSTHLLGNVYTDDFFLKKYYNKTFPDLTYVYIPEELLEQQTKFDVWGDIHFAKFHKDAVKWFRVDIDRNILDKDSFFSSIAAYSMVHLLPGYPIGLMETHKLAKSVRDLKNYYEVGLLRELRGLGLRSEDILEGAVDMNGREFNSFHEILDQISR